MSRLDFSDLKKGVTVYAIIRGDKNGSDWIDLETISYSISGAADCGDSSRSSREWKMSNPMKAVAELRLSVADGAKKFRVPKTPARKAKR